MTALTEEPGRFARIVEMEPDLAQRPARGGFDGLAITFGDVDQLGMLQVLFGEIVANGWTLTLTLDGGETLDVEPLRWAVDDDGTPALIYRKFEQAAACTEAVTFGQIAALHIW